jgi:3-phenylpropionate/cinnamic acid dioxygenase small subunit
VRHGQYLARVNVDDLIARLELDDLGTRYATAVDSKDWDLYRTCFTADAFIDYTAAGGIKGNVDEITAWLDTALAGFTNTIHYVTNRAVTVDGDRGTGRLAYYNPMQLAADTFLVATGYYNDRYVRTSDGWRIAERVEELTWLTTQGPSPSS